MEDLTLNEIELKLFLLKRRTEKAIKMNEETILRLKRVNHERDAFLASLESRPPPILEDDSLYNASPGTSTTEYSDPEPLLDDSSSSDGSEQSSIDETRDDDNISGSSISGSEEDQRHGVEREFLSASSYESSSVTTTASSTASRMEAFLQLVATEERRILARLDRLRSSLTSSEGHTVTARNGSADTGSCRGDAI